MKKDRPGLSDRQNLKSKRTGQLGFDRRSAAAGKGTYVYYTSTYSRMRGPGYKTGGELVDGRLIRPYPIELQSATQDCSG
jgi:hypothetical protein